MKSILLIGTFMFLGAMNAQAQTTVELMEEAKVEYKKYDTKLNEVYKKCLATLEDIPAAKEKLVLAQKEWIKFRDLDCEVISAIYEGGSTRGLMVSDCLLEKTKKRIEELEAFIEG